MFIQGQTLATALSALAFLSHAIPSNAVRFERPAQALQHARSLRPGANGQAFGKRSSVCSTPDIQQLQSEYDSFQSWVKSWVQTAAHEDGATAIAQFTQEFSSYDSYMSNWIASAMNGGGSNSTQSTGTASPISPASTYLSVAPFPTATLSQGGAGPTGTGSPSSGFPSGSGALPTGTVPSGTAPISSAAASSASSSSPSSPPSSGSFNAKAKDNVAVYYGQSAATTQVKLTDLCSDKDVDIVILAFLTTFAGPGGYPTVNFGGACGGSASPAQTAKGATGLLSCPDLGSEIKTCQSAGKKVMLSLGGADASSAFTSDDQATKFATQIWNLFGAGKGEDDLRPFGPGVTVDGFDIDNENKQPAHYDTFVTALRTVFKSDSSKTYYISAAPQCPTPDASIPLDAMKQMDFVWVQFYNNGNCNVGASGFVDAFTTWSKQLSGGPMLYIGAPACGGTACATTGYVPPAQMGGVIKSAMSSGATNMGGVMLWDGAEGYVNKDGSGNYMSVVKSAMD